jgi:hypothetical protein
MRNETIPKIDSSQIFLLLSWSRVPEQNGRILDRSVNEFGKARHSVGRGPCAISSRGGQEPLSDDASRNRSSGTGHPRRGVSSPWPAPPAAGSVRPVRGRATNSLRNQEIGDSNPAKAGLVQSRVTLCGRQAWGLFGDKTLADNRLRRGQRRRPPGKVLPWSWAI